MGIIRMYSKTATIQIMRELNFEMSHPAKGRDTKDPNGNPINTVPNSASVKCKRYLKSGILVAQVAKFNPHNKNRTPILKRFLINGFIPII